MSAAEIPEAARALIAAIEQTPDGRWFIGGDEPELLVTNLATLLEEKLPKGVAKADVDQAIALWNAMAQATANGNPAHKLSKVVKLNPANRKALALRLSEFGAEGWRTCVEAIYRSGHCRGINDRGWKADISYLLQPKGSNKTINGGWPADYQEKSRDGQRTGPVGRGDQRQDGLRGFDAAIRGHLAPGAGREGGGEERGGQPRLAGPRS